MWKTAFKIFDYSWILCPTYKSCERLKSGLFRVCSGIGLGLQNPIKSIANWYEKKLNRDLYFVAFAKVSFDQKHRDGVLEVCSLQLNIEMTSSGVIYREISIFFCQSIDALQYQYTGTCHVRNLNSKIKTQLAFASSKSEMETLEQCVKSVQS